jgi:hypothetical protein
MSSSSNGIGGRSRAEKLCHRIQDLASAYIHLEGIRIRQQDVELNEEDLKPAPFLKPEAKRCATRPPAA